LRPRPSEKIDRNGALMEVFNDDPLTPYSNLANLFGMTTERVRFLVTQRMRKDDPFWKKQSRLGHGTSTHKPCKMCGTLFTPTRSRETYCDEHRGKGYVNGVIPKKVNRRCLMCGRPFQVSLSLLRNSTGRVGVYCANACRKHSLRTRPLRTRGKK
jgi:hypothetical protein